MKQVHQLIIADAKAGAYDRVLSTFEGYVNGSDLSIFPAWFATCPITLIAANLTMTDESKQKLSPKTLEQLLNIANRGSIAQHETATSAIVKLSILGDRIQEALTFMRNCPTRKLRTYFPILWHCARIKDPLATCLFDELLDRSLFPGEEELSLLIQAGVDLERCLRYFADRFETVSDLSLFNTLSSMSTITSIPAGSAICPISSIALRPLGLSESSLDELLALVKRLAIEDTYKHAKQEWEEFERSLASHGSTPSVVIDGANVGHTNQNFQGGFFRHRQVEEVREIFDGQRGGGNALVVVHSKWLKEGVDLKQNLEIGDQQSGKKKRKLPPLKKVEPDQVSDDRDWMNSSFSREAACPPEVPESKIWRSLGCLIEVPRGANDDWFWLYATLWLEKQRRLKSGIENHSQLSPALYPPETSEPGNRNPILVSNDQMRDHVFRMGIDPLIWRRFAHRHICRFKITYPEEEEDRREYLFELPPVFSRLPQKGLGNVWHLPVADGLVQGDAFLVLRL